MTVIEYVHRGIDSAVTHECEARGEDDSGIEHYSCGGEYVCPGCERVRGYCRGATDELLELCDACFMVVLRYRKMWGVPLDDADAA